MVRSRITSKHVATIALVGVALLIGAALNERDLVLRNPSPSVPAGYYVRTSAEVVPGSFATVRAIDVAAAYAATRNFADSGDRFIKRVAATGGDEVCARGPEVSISGAIIAHRIERDAAGRELPTWAGCRVLAADELLLLGDTPDSFDGRYWGPVPTSLIEGVWQPLH